MLTWAANVIMRRRAKRVLGRIEVHLPEEGNVADVGSGTGHNAELIRDRLPLSVQEFDVADLHWVGQGPELIRDGQIPRATESFDAVLLLYVLHYPKQPLELLREVARISDGPVVVLQSTYQGKRAGALIRHREFLFGRFGYYVARAARLVGRADGALRPRQYFTRDELCQCFAEAGLRVTQIKPERTLTRGVTRDLFLLEKA